MQSKDAKRIRHRIALGCVLALSLLFCSGAGLSAQTKVEKADDCCDAPTAEEAKAALEKSGVTGKAYDVPDLEVIDQAGKTHRFGPDLIAGKTVVIGFFFTRCTTICPPLTATMAQMQDLLIAGGHKDVAFLSISLDPTHDTPARLATWAKTFGADPGWTFLTGESSTIDEILREFGVAVARPEDHAPILLVGNESSGVWRREYALAPAGDLVEKVLEVRSSPVSKGPVSKGPVSKSPVSKSPVAEAGDSGEAGVTSRPVNESAHGWFTDLPIVDQHGQTHRLYTDLIRGRTVVVSCFFSTCTGICPVMHRNLLEIASAFEGDLGKDLFFLLVSVDPETDTPERLATFANGLGVDAGWSFLTGTPEQVNPVLHKFGLTTVDKESHKGIFLVGNDRTGLWEKALGLGKSEDLIPIVDRVLHDVNPEAKTPLATPGANR